MADVIPFPATRRVHQLRKTAAYIASASPGVAESHLRVQVDGLAKRLTDKGVAPDRVGAEVTAYRAALQAEIWRAVLTPEGAA